MHVRPTSPVGAEVTDLAVADVDAETAESLRDLLAEHGVLVLRDQELDDDAFLGFLRLMGEPTFTAGETPLEGYPDLNVISNVGRTTPPRSSFHVDTSYVDVPPAYTALRAVQVPSRGGATQFSNQYAAAQDLPDELRRRVEGRTIRHVVTGVDPGPGEQTEAEHPVLRPHPRTGREVLFLTTPPRCAAVSGLDDDEAAALVQELFEHSTRDENVLDHAWAPGDVVVWDNGCVMHRADHSGVEGDRVMHRGMVTAREG